MNGPQNLNTPLPFQICNSDGSLTPQGQAFLRKLWERTGSAPGTDVQWIAQEADQGILSGAQALSAATAAMREAQDVLALAQQTLLQAQGMRAQVLKALELAQDYATISLTARPPSRDGSQSDESMIFSIMKT